MKPIQKILLDVENEMLWFPEDSPRTFAEKVATKYAEQVVVAFAEWKESAYIFDAFKGKYISLYFDFECEKLSDLYQYFITNVYNK